ncbi:DNA polymerase I [Pseudoalteromonas sp. OFAV1]|uniref:DNA polymerase I n=1 Tax=Pseudoalteromonas sp. OFAV1 TaxID=2908892 RepID=UPI001F23A1ED|nr:DNA polymerase I [Pseudoalteromonas sp. OFAV1]MCF2902256.1 DNA polymerase I [Pseudoalteromonas sp. OFAV1]
MKKKFLIVDGYSFLYRAHSALPPLNNRKGDPTGAITGFLNMVNSILTKHKPDNTVITFDVSGKNFRHELFANYKANRKPMEDELRAQIVPLKEIIRAWGLPQLEVAGYEADDVMGTLAKIAVSDGYDVIISTSDKDMAQCISENVSILDTKDASTSNVPYGPAGVFEKYGVHPNQIIDFLALMGDKADNVPGVDGCGQKTAAKWLEQYDSLENLLDNADEIKGKIGEKLRAQKESVLLSKKLVTINTNVPISQKPEEFISQPNFEELFELCSYYELNAFKKALKLKDPNAKTLELNVVSDKDEIKNLSKLYFSGNIVIEVVPTNPSLLIVMFESKTYLIDIKLNASLIKEKIIGNPNLKIISNNAKSVIKTLISLSNNESVQVNSFSDTRLIDYVLNGGRSKQATIAMLNELYCKLELSELRDTYKLDDKSPKWEKMSIDEIITVIAEEAYLAYCLVTNVGNNFELDESFHRIYNLEMRTLNALASMELQGVKADKEHLLKMRESIKGSLDTLKGEIHELAEMEFNIQSPKQVANVLFEHLGIESKKKSTAEKVLIGLADKHPIINKILEYRGLQIIYSTFIEGLLGHLTENDTLHTTYNQTITSTGRLSSSDPNLQNIPIRSENGKQLRKAFVANSGYKIVAFDFSQIELRILAHLAEVDRFIEVFNDPNSDVHANTAIDIFNVELSQVTDEQRRKAKAVNFGLIYGLSAKSLANDLQISLGEAKLHISAFLGKYNFDGYMSEQLEYAKKNLHVRTLYGRKVPTLDVNTKNAFARNHAELAAKNGGIQGTAADIIKMATVDVFQRYLGNDDVRMLMQVHDELVFEIKEEALDIVCPEIKKIMESTVKLSVPLVVNYGISDNWLDSH